MSDIVFAISLTRFQGDLLPITLCCAVSAQAHSAKMLQSVADCSKKSGCFVVSDAAVCWYSFVVPLRIALGRKCSICGFIPLVLRATGECLLVLKISPAEVAGDYKYGVLAGIAVRLPAWSWCRNNGCRHRRFCQHKW